jgi:iron-sulfur cluster repair protein YtfE (RIC family)
MRRHSALAPLSHDHHHALVAARRVRQAAAEPEAAAAAASSFLDFFAEETIRHFREEEELLFPLIVPFDEARELLVEALLQHQRLHSLVLQLHHRAESDAGYADLMREAGELLEGHIRLEERGLFPLIERLLESDELAELALGPSA